MAKIHFLGTCSGTEPMPNMHHCSFVIETENYNYWFDAGENCAHRAHTTGIDVMKTRALFVSHPHLDHVGGLPNLLACMRKLVWRQKRKLVCDNTMEVFFPGLPYFQMLKSVACNGSSTFRFLFTMNEHEVEDGLLYEDEIIKVSALHNHHMKEDGSNGWHSYSYLIELEGKKIVYSGDVAEPAELDPFMEGGCDLYIMETGHHPVSDVCEYAISRGAKELIFNHHGREILENRPACERLVANYASGANISIKLAYDGMEEII